MIPENPNNTEKYKKYKSKNHSKSHYLQTTVINKNILPGER